MVAGLRNADIWVMDVTRPGSPTQLTFDSRAIAMRWVDGKRLVFARGEGAFVGNVEGSGETKLEEVAKATAPADALRYVVNVDAGKLALITLGGSVNMAPVGSANGRSRDGELSPDGRFIAYASSESGQEKIYTSPCRPPRAALKHPRAAASGRNGGRMGRSCSTSARTGR